MSYHEQYSDTDIDIEKLITISTVNKIFSRKFNSYVHDYAITFNHSLLPPIDDLFETFQILYETFTYLFDRLLRDFSDDDYVRIVILSDTLDSPIVIPYLPLNWLSVDMVFDAIADVLNSQDQFDITDGFRIHVTRTVLPGGSGGHARSSEIAFQTWFKKKSRTIISIPNKDNLCLARAIVVAVEDKELKIGSKKNFHRFVQNVGASLKQTLAALELHKSAALASNLPSYDLSAVAILQTACPYRIHVYNHFLTSIFTGSREDPKGHIYLLLFDNHYGVIRSMKSFTGRRQFCDECLSGFDSTIHKCISTKCRLCNNIRCLNDNNHFSTGKFYCSQCGKTFYSALCSEAHVCVRSETCSVCNKMYPYKRRKEHRRACGKFRCPVCNAYFDLPREDHFCYVQRLVVDCDSDSSDGTSPMHNVKPKDEIFWFDFETMFVDEGRHIPILLVCVHSNETRIFKGETLMTDFFNMVSDYMKQTKARLIFLAHNASGFDNMLILRGAYDQGLTPKIFYRRSKILMLELFSRVRFLCSYQFLPFSLRVLAKNFGLKLQKLYFPYLLTRKQYADQEICFPAEEFFNPKSLRSNEYMQFKNAYDEMKADYEPSGKRYNIMQELEKYCVADVLVLSEIGQKFAVEFQAMTSLSPFSTGITLPSVCLTVSTTAPANFQHAASIPKRRHCNKDAVFKDLFRVVAMEKYSEWNIYSRRAQPWCAYHSCEKHYPDGNGLNQLTKTTHSQMRTKNLAKQKFLQDTSCSLIEEWECTFAREMVMNNDLQQLAKNMGLSRMNRLIPRDALYGGRVEAFNLFAEKTDVERIDYYDFVSLYPTVMVGDYSIGRPEILYGFMLGPVNSIDFNSYRGLLYIKILAPKDNMIPILPYRTEKHGLTFPLCAACAVICQRQLCAHSDKERAMIGVWSHIEIQVALKEDYKILEVYEIYHFVNHSSDVFKTYVDTFMAAKIRNSGFPPNVVSPLDQQAYVESLKQVTGISLSTADINNNPVRKSIAKLCLNSLCNCYTNPAMYMFHLKGGNLVKTLGKKQQKLYPSQQNFTNSTQVHRLKLKTFFIINENLLHVTYSEMEDTRTRGTTCLMVAIETTAKARVKLFSLLKSLGAHRLIYTDTDSVIFRSIPTDWKPATGNFFGQLQDEIAGKFGGGYINRFVSLGCKTYAMEIIDEQGEHRYETRCKGISLNMRTMKNINFDSMLNLLKNNVNNVSIMEEPFFIQRVKIEAKLASVFRRKILQFTFRKRVVDHNTFSTVPLGYLG